MTTRGGLTQDGTLLVAWVLRICLQELAEDGDDFAEQMLDLGHPIDLLRAEAAALPKESRPGLIVQPYVWALAVAMLDIESRRREGRSDRCCADARSIASLETRRIAAEVEGKASAFVELTFQYLDARSTGASTLAGLDDSAASPSLLYGACEMCKTSPVKCHRYSPTLHRPELCMCVHGACHHVCRHPRLDPSLQTFSEPSTNLESGAAWSARAPAPQTAPVTSDLTAVELLRRGAMFISSVGHAGIRDLLGLKRTAGSIDGRLPPPRRALLESLNKLHVPPPTPVADEKNAGATRSGECPGDAEGIAKPERRTKRGRATIVCNLTVGGRALCKHAVRAKDGWWGEYGGTEADKNDRAQRIVLQILAGATWVNLHVFGGGGEDGVFEVREALGYGARWSADGATFRGFLEPHTDDGHEKGWRH